MLVPVPTRCRIPEILRSRGLTQSWLADKTGLSRHRVSDYARMVRIMTLQTAYMVATTLHVQVGELYVWEWREQE